MTGITTVKSNTGLEPGHSHLYFARNEQICKFTSISEEWRFLPIPFLQVPIWRIFTLPAWFSSLKTLIWKTSAKSVSSDLCTSLAINYFLMKCSFQVSTLLQVRNLKVPLLHSKISLLKIQSFHFKLYHCLSEFPLPSVLPFSLSNSVTSPVFFSSFDVIIVLAHGCVSAEPYAKNMVADMQFIRKQNTPNILHR